MSDIEQHEKLELGHLYVGQTIYSKLKQYSIYSEIKYDESHQNSCTGGLLRQL